MNPHPPFILVTNDDGIGAVGLHSLARALSRVGRGDDIAPDREQSAPSHALTPHRPLRVNRQDEGVYSVDGTPTDCVNLGILNLQDSARLARARLLSAAVTVPRVTVRNRQLRQAAPVPKNPSA